MFLINKDGCIDLDLDTLGHILKVLDEQLDAYQRFYEYEFADGSLFDVAEYVIGLGFVACQGYQVATYGFLKIDKRSALEKGPDGAPGYTFAQLVHHAANYWKHKEEWQLEPGSRREKDTRAGLAAMGCTDTDEHPLTRALGALVRPRKSRLEFLLTRLEAWRDALPLAGLTPRPLAPRRGEE